LLLELSERHAGIACSAVFIIAVPCDRLDDAHTLAVTVTVTVTVTAVTVTIVKLFSCTPLHLACFGAHVETVKWLVSAGADTAMLDKNGQPPGGRFDAGEYH
jgi:hypothetical protein